MSSTSVTVRGDHRRSAMAAMRGQMRDQPSPASPTPPTSSPRLRARVPGPQNERGVGRQRINPVMVRGRLDQVDVVAVGKDAEFPCCAARASASGPRHDWRPHRLQAGIEDLVPTNHLAAVLRTMASTRRLNQACKPALSLSPCSQMYPWMRALLFHCFPFTSSPRCAIGVGKKSGHLAQEPIEQQLKRLVRRIHHRIEPPMTLDRVRAEAAARSGNPTSRSSYGPACRIPVPRECPAPPRRRR